MYISPRLASWESLGPVFVEHGAQAYAEIAGAMAGYPDVVACPNPLGALHAVRLASFAGRATDPFVGDPQAFVADYRRLPEEVAAGVARPVQFTEPLRMADLLPGLLLAARWAEGAPLSLVELGAGAGLLLAPEAFRIQYPSGVWPPHAQADAMPLAHLGSHLEVPSELLAQPLNISARIGVDLQPLDPAGSFDYLRSFAWPGDPDREVRLRDALEAVAHRKPEVMGGDAVDLLPELLAQRRESVTVVIDSGFSTYLDGVSALRLGRALDAAAARGRVILLRRSGLRQPEGALRGAVALVDLTRRQIAEYAHTDLLSERVVWRPRAVGH